MSNHPSGGFVNILELVDSNWQVERKFLMEKAVTADRGPSQARREDQDKQVGHVRHVSTNAV